MLARLDLIYDLSQFYPYSSNQKVVAKTGLDRIHPCIYDLNGYFLERFGWLGVTNPNSGSVSSFKRPFFISLNQPPSFYKPDQLQDLSTLQFCLNRKDYGLFPIVMRQLYRLVR